MSIFRLIVRFTFGSLVLFSCATPQQLIENLVSPNPPPIERPNLTSAPRPGGRGVAEEIRASTEFGSPSSLLQALDLISEEDLSGSEFGRVMTLAAVTLMQKIYPYNQAQLPVPSPPKAHIYTRIIADAEKGTYLSPAPQTTDFLEYVLPFLTYLNETEEAKLLDAELDLLRAKDLQPQSVFPAYFLGLVYERLGQIEAAQTEYSLALDLSDECYPAALGLARVKIALGLKKEAVQLYANVAVQFPDNLDIKRLLAYAYYDTGDWLRAEPAIAELLQRNSRDGDLLLMRARVLVEQGQFMQAQAPLDLYASINSNSQLYLFLRARVQNEGYKNRDSALNYLRSLIRNPAIKAEDIREDVAVYTVQLLLESTHLEDQAQGRDLLERMLSSTSGNPAILSLALVNAINQEDWKLAREYLRQVLEVRRSFDDLLNGFTVETGLGNHAAALSYARELHALEPGNEEGNVAYIQALINTGRHDEAEGLIEARLKTLSGGTLKSRYYFLRSRLKTGEDAVLTELRSSLYEDPRNVNALIAMFNIYHKKRDDRRAVYYLKQALALAPENAELKRYESDFAALLTGNF
ncbi:tetratricopeptide repeat protein [Breznakiellaceae bacterium SP9]